MKIELQPPSRFSTDAEIAKWTWKHDTLPRLRDAGLSERYCREITDWGNKRQANVYRQVSRLLQRKGAIVALTGSRGTGKTTIAAQLIVDRAKNEALPPWQRQPPYRRLTDLVSKYKPLYADFGSTNVESLTESRTTFCGSHPLVIIDEIHECGDLKFGGKVLTDLIDRRYAANNDTVLISNQTPEEFRATWSDSILSRLAEHGLLISCDWTSWRKPKAYD